MSENKGQFEPSGCKELTKAKDNTGSVTGSLGMNRSLRQKLISAYRNQLSLPYDVTFSVASTTGEKVLIGAHSFVLAISSPDLDEVVGESRRNESGTIELVVSKGNERTLKCFLEYLYCGKADLRDFTYQEIMDVMSLANEYKVSDVIAKCSEYLIKLLTVKNAVQVLEFLASLNSTSLSNGTRYEASFSKCFDFVLRHLREIVKSGSFLHLSESNIRLLLSSDYMPGLSELDLFEACLKWGRFQHQSLLLSTTHLPLRAMLSDLLSYIRFPLMTPDEFASFVITQDILHKDELIDMFIFFSNSKEDKQNVTATLFSKVPRVSLPEQDNNGKLNFSNIVQLTSEMKPGQLNEISSSLKDYLYDNEEWFVMINHKLQWNELISRFAREIQSKTRQRMRSFILEKVQLEESGEKIPKTIVRLRSLKEFRMNLMCDKEKTKVITESLKTNFYQYLFFTTRSKKSSPQYIWKLETDILLKLNGVTILEINHAAKSLVINGLRNYSAVLESCKNEDINSLCISLECPRSRLGEILSFSSTLTNLGIHNFNYLGRTGLFNLSLWNMGNLRELILHKCGFQSIDLALIAKSQLTGVKNLSVSYAHVICTSEAEEKEEETFQNLNLESLTLWNCSWNNSLYKSLHRFKYLQSLCINNDQVGSRRLAPFINLFAQRKWFAKELIVAGLIWGVDGTNSNQQDEDEDEAGARQVRGLLDRFNISKNKVRLRLTDYYTDTRTPECQRCVTLSELTLDEMMFERFKLNAFFESLKIWEENSYGKYT